MEGEMFKLGIDRDANPIWGYRTAVREKAKAERAYTLIECQIRDTRAKTIQGMAAKIRCAKAYAKSDTIEEIEGGSCAGEMAWSIFQDIQALV
jgi:hypothetical protein